MGTCQWLGTQSSAHHQGNSRDEKSCLEAGGWISVVRSAPVVSYVNTIKVVGYCEVEGAVLIAGGTVSS